jgi:hypothetical protein
MTEVRRGSFESLVTSPTTHVALDLDGEGGALLILFGGIAGGVSMPVFEFFRLTAEIPGQKLFLRDPRRAWYQLGIPGIGDSAASVRDFLQQTIARSGATRVVMAGASAGGYAALLFGAWCGVDEILAFSPQTFIDAENRRQHGDDRWQPQIAALHEAMAGRDAALDLCQELARADMTPRMQVHVSSDDPLDLLHAHRLHDVANVDIVEHDHGGHRLVKTLRERGLLKPMLLAALAGE